MIQIFFWNYRIHTRKYLRIEIYNDLTPDPPLEGEGEAFPHFEVENP
jgi:hypothetical protein